MDPDGMRPDPFGLGVFYYSAVAVISTKINQFVSHIANTGLKMKNVAKNRTGKDVISIGAEHSVKTKGIGTSVEGTVAFNSEKGMVLSLENKVTTPYLEQTTKTSAYSELGQIKTITTTETNSVSPDLPEIKLPEQVSLESGAVTTRLDLKETLNVVKDFFGGIQKYVEQEAEKIKKTIKIKNENK